MPEAALEKAGSAQDDETVQLYRAVAGGGSDDANGVRPRRKAEISEYATIRPYQRPGIDWITCRARLARTLAFQPCQPRHWEAPSAPARGRWSGSRTGVEPLVGLDCEDQVRGPVALRDHLSRHARCAPPTRQYQTAMFQEEEGKSIIRSCPANAILNRSVAS
jgi:hypothetical protein